MSDDSLDLTRDLAHDMPDPALEALLRRALPDAPAGAEHDLAARIIAQAALPLAARRRNARTMRDTSMADTLADWVRIAMPIAIAAALIAVLALSRAERVQLADAELRDSDPAALFSALDADGTSGLTDRVITLDAGSPVTVEKEIP